jgi:hypothetical protein
MNQAYGNQRTFTQVPPQPLPTLYYSGQTIAGYQPGQIDYNGVVSYVSNWSQTWVVIELGSNECRTAVQMPAATFGSQMQTLCTQLISNGCAGILLCGDYVNYQTGNGQQWTQASMSLLWSYYPQLASIVANDTTGKLHLGPCNGYDAFTTNPSWLYDGDHPNNNGYQWWATQIYESLARAVGIAPATGSNHVIGGGLMVDYRRSPGLAGIVNNWVLAQ